VNQSGSGTATAVYNSWHEANGYASPRDLYRLAGMNENETSASNFCCSKFAAITTHPASELERLAFTCRPIEPDALYLLGNIISPDYLSRVRAIVCPDCVAEKGFIEAHWHISLMVACPIHGRGAVRFCPKM
jgi:TniQ